MSRDSDEEKDESASTKMIDFNANISAKPAKNSRERMTSAAARKNELRPLFVNKMQNLNELSTEKSKKAAVYLTARNSLDGNIIFSKFSQIDSKKRQKKKHNASQKSKFSHRDSCTTLKTNESLTEKMVPVMLQTLQVFNPIDHDKLVVSGVTPRTKDTSKVYSPDNPAKSKRDSLRPTLAERKSAKIIKSGTTINEQTTASLNEVASRAASSKTSQRNDSQQNLNSQT